jgi:D-threonate/D-erythronate kinase
MIGVIADDLTGAAEIGAVGLRYGLSAEIVVSGKPGGKAKLICMDTDSRSCDAGEARRRAASAANALRKAGADWIYKKVDSVLRGNVIPELEAVMKQLRMERALLVPANPSLGRTIEDGHYFIHGKPINKTEFLHHPEHPRTSARVLDCLGRPKYFPIQVCGINGSPPAPGITVGECRATNNLQKWAAQRDDGTLIAGAAEFFEALLEARGYPPLPKLGKTETPSMGARELFVCGTASPRAADLAIALRAQQAPIFSLPAELAWGAEFGRAAMTAIARRIITAFKSHPRVLLHVGLPLTRRPFIAGELTPHLTGVAEMVLRQTEVGHVYAEGGATSVALVRRMGWQRLNVMRELAPGIATLAVEGNKSFLLTIKPGSYAWPSRVLNGQNFSANI